MGTGSVGTEAALSEDEKREIKREWMKIMLQAGSQEEEEEEEEEEED